MRRNNKCCNGHEMTPENTVTKKTGTGTGCRQCANDYWREYYYRKVHGLKRAPPRGTPRRRRPVNKGSTNE